MNMTSRLMGGAMSFAHLAGIGKPAAKKAKAKAAEDDTPADDEDDPKASEDEDGDDAPPTGKKGKKAKAAEDDSPSEDDDTSAAEDDDDEPSAEEDDDEPEASEDEDEDDAPPTGKKGKKAVSAEYRRGQLAERKRCAAIFASPVAARNIPAAAHLAFNTGQSATSAVSLLKTMAPAASTARRDRNPDLGSDPDGTNAGPAQAGKSWGRAFAQVVPAARSAGGMGGALRKAAGV